MTDWPWEYLYTMAISFLGLDDNAFWKMSPRRLVAMIEQWKKIQRALAGIPEPTTEDTPMPSAEADMWAAWDRM